MNKILCLAIILLGNSYQVNAQSATDAVKPGTSFKDCDICPEMVVLPAGSFIMGTPQDERGYQPDESPQHKVTFSRPFAIGIYAVTAEEWEAYIQETGAPRRSGDTRPGRACTEGKPSYPYESRQPAVCMTYHDAENYAKWLTEKTGKPYRLPSESEWEYAARAGSEGPFPFPFDEEGGFTINKHANLDGDQDGFKYTAPVGSFPPNAFGLFDMHGNIHEWVADCFHGNHFNAYVGAPDDGSAWIEGGDCSVRQIRGNDWIEPPIFSRSGNRNDRPVGTIGDWLGFRVVRDL